MNKFTVAVAGLLLSSLVLAQAPVASAVSAPGILGCDMRAVDKNGKHLAGAAKKSFMKKCQADAMGPAARTCEAKAIGKNGKALAGAAKSSFMKRCIADAA